jgi:hypothetical protein
MIVKNLSDVDDQALTDFQNFLRKGLEDALRRPTVCRSHEDNRRIAEKERAMATVAMEWERRGRGPRR